MTLWRDLRATVRCRLDMLGIVIAADRVEAEQIALLPRPTWERDVDLCGLVRLLRETAR